MKNQSTQETHQCQLQAPSPADLCCHEGEVALTEPINLIPQPEAEPEDAWTFANVPGATLAWTKRLLAGNPFYPISAALLLYAVYRLSVDPRIFGTEVSQLFFNFGSLHLYELLLVLTAIVLARRKIWYDSSLLVCLENLLVFVPFILVSHAILMADGLAWFFCLIGAVLVVARFAGLGRFFPEWPMPGRLLAGGGLLLGANVILPLMFRAVHKTREALTGNVQLDAYSLVCWAVVLPLLLAAANLLPRRGPAPGAPRFLPAWLPTAVFGVWIGATTVHLYSIGYVYELKWGLSHLVPLLWVFAWTARNRLADFFAHPSPRLLEAFLVLPALVSLAALWDRNLAVFFGVNLVNAAIYCWLAVRRDGGQFAFNLMLASLAAALVGMPEAAAARLIPEFTRGETLLAFVALYLMARSVSSRDPGWGLAGGATLIAAIRGIFPILPVEIALQAGLFYTLLHSLRWPGGGYWAGMMRGFIAVTWVLHSAVWMQSDREMALGPVVVFAGSVLGIYCLAGILFGKWGPKIVAAAAGLVIAIGPVMHLGLLVQTVSAGVLALIGSFVLFGLGTALALLKQTWDAGPEPGEVDTPRLQ